ncbi:MAG: hypothetical protein LBV79_10630 [Candidatus Adiutrix sp.]|jgi:adenosylhomocysteine nucleosidase|nr:hypothetical protein [Candidatus Adiutrix sp.]
MTAALPEILVFTPTPNEYRAGKEHVERAAFVHFTASVVESGPGKINAAFAMTAEVLPRIAAGRKPMLVMGSGTSGSLNASLAAGDMIASNSAVISDWLMDDGKSRQFGPYGQFVYRGMDDRLADEMALECADPAVEKLLAALPAVGFKRGRLCTADTFVAGLDNKLGQGRAFGALACDMESGAFAFTAGKLLRLPWLNLRVVADTLNETLSDYFEKEGDMVDILGAKTARALTILDGLL